jgi:hypothetical protein
MSQARSLREGDIVIATIAHAGHGFGIEYYEATVMLADDAPIADVATADATARAAAGDHAAERRTVPRNLDVIVCARSLGLSARVVVISRWFERHTL